MNEVVGSSMISSLMDMDLRYSTSLPYFSCRDNLLLWDSRVEDAGSYNLKDNKNLFIPIIVMVQMRIRQ